MTPGSRGRMGSVRVSDMTPPRGSADQVIVTARTEGVNVATCTVGANRHALRRPWSYRRSTTTLPGVTRYRFLDPMGDVIAEREFDDHDAARAWAENDAEDDDELDEPVQRVEYLGPGGDWRWAGALSG